MKVRIGPDYVLTVPLLILTWLVLFGSIYAVLFLGGGFGAFVTNVNTAELLIVSLFLGGLLAGAPLMTYELFTKNSYLELDETGFTDNTTLHVTAYAGLKWTHLLLTNRARPDLLTSSLLI